MAVAAVVLRELVRWKTRAENSRFRNHQACILLLLLRHWYRSSGNDSNRMDHLSGSSPTPKHRIQHRI